MHRNNGIPVRRRVCVVEGGALYEAERDGKFLVIEDQGTLLDLMNDEDREGFEPEVTYEFETAADRVNFLIQRKCMATVTSERKAFLDAQIFCMSLMATVQRNRYVYRRGASDWSKRMFRAELRYELERIVKQYNESTTETQHMQNIVSLAERISASSRDALQKEGFRIGAAQKILNLYLKYMWCLGQLPLVPPHCPFDALVLKGIGCGNESWTEATQIEQYVEWVQKAEVKANGLSLAEWELREYNKFQRGLLGEFA